MLKLYTFLNDDTPKHLLKIGKSDESFLREGWAVKNLLAHMTAFERPSSPSPYKQVIIVKFSDTIY